MSLKVKEISGIVKRLKKITYGSFQRAFSPDDNDNKDVIEFS